MSTLSVTNRSSKQSSGKVVFPRVTQIYKSENGLWRGFMTPYDVSFEAKTKKKVEEILPKLVELYEEGLKKYDYPEHLKHVPISNEEDALVFDKYLAEYLQTMKKISN